MKKLLLITALLALCTFTVRAQKQSVKSTQIVLVDGQDFYLHTPEQGETLYSLSRLYDVPIDRIEFDNPQLKEGGLKVGQTIKILCADKPESRISPRKQARTFDEHTIMAGETTYSIARKYSLSVSVLVEDNPGLDPADLSTGQKLKIRKSEMGGTSPKKLLSEIDEYAITLTNVSDGFVYHVAEMGETIYGISRQYGVTPESIMASNDLRDGLKAGAMIKIPSADKTVASGGEGQQPDNQSYPPGIDQYDGGYSPGTGSPQSILPEEYRYVQPDYAYNGLLDIAMLLPLSGRNNAAGSRNNFVELYQGALIALEDFKAQGYNIKLNLYDTQRSTETTSSIVRSPSFSSTNLIIGPVYEEAMQPVMEFAYQHKVPVVSPLGNMGAGYGSLLYQMAPTPEARYDKLRDILTADKNIILITSDTTDLEFEREVKSLLNGVRYQTAVYSKGQVTTGFVDSILNDHTRESVFVVVAGNELGVDNILATISSVQNNRLARSKRTALVKVVGNSRWTRYSNLDKNLFFKLNVSFVTNYHADRSNDAVREFDRRYMKAFSAVPSLYSYRGYDAVKLFVGAITGERYMNFTRRLDAVATPLQSNYEFRLNQLGNNCNDQWALVTYRSDYTVSVE